MLQAADFVITNLKELRTCEPSLGEGPTGLIRDATIAVRDGQVSWVGRSDELVSQVDTSSVEVVDGEGRAAIPGFVDAHTHLVFAGWRGEEFSARSEGRPYTAGGILTTVEATRATPSEELLRMTLSRADRMLQHGTTTAEAKSGYSLDVDGEVRLLEVLNDVHRTHPLDLEITFCGAHALPHEFEGRPDDFISLMVEAAPKAAGLARWVDVFCDVGAFTPQQSVEALKAGVRVGLMARIHANELASSGGVGAAVQVGAVTADHLLHVDEGEARALADAGCIAVLCPATALGLGRFPPVETLRTAGVPIVLASDFNPGSAYGENIQFAAWIASRAMGMSPLDCLLAMTATAADSLKRQDIGRLRPGCLADIVLLDAESAIDIGYHASVNLAAKVYKRGRLFVPSRP